MIILESVQTCRAWSQKQNNIALIPTMGALHAGHLELVKQAKNFSDNILVSIFVNPSQFGINEDFDKYPRQLEEDLTQLKKLNVQAVFTPSVEEMYPSGTMDTTIIQPRNITKKFCGKTRPNLFPGAAPIVTKLINCCNAKYLILGNKDYQQKIILTQTINDLLIDCKVIGVNTQRNSSNLALSSRNKYLSITEKKLASNIYQTLKTIEEAIQTSTDFNNICNQAKINLETLGISVEYLTIKNKTDLAAPTNKSLIILIAAKVGTTRLIDNLEVKRP